MRKYALLLGLMVLAWSPGVLAATEERSPEFLFVQSAKSIVFNDGTLTLREISPSTVFFSDRPDRIVGHVRNDHFLKLWVEGKNSFKTDPPNATLSVFAPEGRPTQAIVVLSNPRADSDSLSYDVQVLEGTIPAEGAESTLFIDGGDAPCTDPGKLAADDSSYSGYPCWADNVFSDSGR